MSTVSGVRGFSLAMYGQSGAVMDWTGLTDPFTQIFPLKVTNAYSGTLWFQGNLTIPRSGYYAFSGVQMGSVASGASAVLNMTWDVGVSGWIVSSSPITDSLTLVVGAFTSSNYTGLYGSGSFSLSNTLFTRWSGVIKVFGDIYNNDVPMVSLAKATGGTMVSGQEMVYALSYFLSGWESDVGSSTNELQMTSGFTAYGLSWTPVAGVAQYAVWRWSGTAGGGPDFATYQIIGGLGQALQPMDLMAITSGSSFTDTNGVPLQTGHFRNRKWTTPTGGVSTADSTTFLTAPSALDMQSTSVTNSHAFYLKKNVSGNSLIGPWWMVFHLRGGAGNNYGLLLSQASDAKLSGTLLADSTTLGTLANVWYRHAIYVSGYNTSGWFNLQIVQGASTLIVDDVYIVAQS